MIGIVTMTNALHITAADAGVWLDGSQGWRNSARAVWRAQEYGFHIDADDIAIVAEYADGNDCDGDRVIVLPSGETIAVDMIGECVTGQGGLTDRATDYLNSLAPDGYEFVWDMGELSLYARTWYCQTCGYSTEGIGEDAAETEHARHDGAHYPVWADEYFGA